MSTTEVPDGYMRNALGHLVPRVQVREQDLMRDQVARDLAAMAIQLNDDLKKFKSHALGDIADLVRLAGERYGIEMGGKKGNVTITSYDGEFKVVRAYAELIGFTEELEVAKELISTCIDRWSEGSNANIRALVDKAFRANGKGHIKTAAILELLRLEILDEDWQQAMKAITDSIQTTGTAVYVRVYRRIGMSDQYQAIPLDLAGV